MYYRSIHGTLRCKDPPVFAGQSRALGPDGWPESTAPFFWRRKSPLLMVINGDLMVINGD